MKIEYDPNKNQANMTSRGIDFAIAVDFDWHTALVIQDERHNYGEARYIAMGRIDERLHVLVFTVRGEVIRVISLRKANKKEVKHYENQTRND